LRPVWLEQRDYVLAVLQQEFGRTCGDRLILIDRIALLRQDDANSSFRVVDHALLRAN